MPVRDSRRRRPSPLQLRKKMNTSVLRWYKRHGRSLPWRATDDPYDVLISEVMLQQTQVSRVLVHYPGFLALFPSLPRLADAEQKAVVTAWRGLGYNNRAVRLHRLARIVMQRHDGALPADIMALRRLPGIGRYTAHALMVFAHGGRVPLVDINIRRLYSRVFWRMHEVSELRPENEIWTLAELLVPPERAYDWNQALMDLGAMICTARNPACAECPLRTICRSNGLLRSTAMKAPRSEPSRWGIPHRVFRGRIIEFLRERNLPSRDIHIGAAIAKDFQQRDRPWLAGILHRLQRDGLVRLCIGRNGDVEASLA